MEETTFNSWISDNADIIKRRLRSISAVDEDAFQETYLSLASEFRMEEETGNAFEKAFIKVYQRISRKHFRETYETLYADEAFLSLIPAEDEETDGRKDRKPMADRIRKHIRSTFPQRDVTAFEMRMKGFSYRDISDTLGIGATAINSTMERIIAQTRLQFAAVAL